jgi:mycothiol synthase
VRAIDVFDRPTQATRQAITELVEQISDRAEAPLLSDQTWLALRNGDAPVLAVLARSVRGSEPTPALVGVALVVASNHGSMLEVVVEPGLADASRVSADLAETAIDWHARLTGGRLTWWTDDSASAEPVASRHGLVADRILHEMRRSLPLSEHGSITSRPFRPGVDDAAWLAVNNRAFAGHGEQGGWTIEQLHTRFTEAWFDADGFRVVDADDGSMAAFCWTKIHRDHDPPLGEIYVIGVDPTRHGSGLGRQATLAGLDWLSDQALTLATLYVDADNSAAMSLYRRLGFDIHRTRTAFTGTLAGLAPDMETTRR